MDEYLYRAVSYRHGLGCDEFENPYPGFSVGVNFNKYEIVKRTKCGAWIRDDRYKSNCFYPAEERKPPLRFILLTARKQFASETKQKAIECFIARKQRYLQILRSKTQECEMALNIAKNFDYENDYQNRKTQYGY